jgi:hypothetical protein
VPLIVQWNIVLYCVLRLFNFSFGHCVVVLVVHFKIYLIIFNKEATEPSFTNVINPVVFSGVRVTRSLVLCVCFVDLCLSFCTFSFGHCVVCSWSIYGLWLPLWFLQTLLLIIIPWWSFEHKKTMTIGIGYPVLAWHMHNMWRGLLR